MKGIDIKVSRIKSGIKSYELANKLGITPDIMSKIELDHIRPNKELSRKISSVLKEIKKGN